MMMLRMPFESTWKGTPCLQVPLYALTCAWHPLLHGFVAEFQRWHRGPCEAVELGYEPERCIVALACPWLVDRSVFWVSGFKHCVHRFFCAASHLLQACLLLERLRGFAGERRQSPSAYWRVRQGVNQNRNSEVKRSRANPDVNLSSLLTPSGMGDLLTFLLFKLSTQLVPWFPTLHFDPTPSHCNSLRNAGKVSHARSLLQ